MINPIDELIRFQTDRGLNKQPYNPLNEATNTFEEVLESLGYDVPKASRPLLKDKLSLFIDQLITHGIVCRIGTRPHDRIDAHADQIVFAVGALLKLGMCPNAVLTETAKEINSRVGTMVDGKFEKDLTKSDDWYTADYSNCSYGG